MSFRALITQLSAEHEALQAQLVQVTAENHILRARLSRANDVALDSENKPHLGKLLNDEPQHSAVITAKPLRKTNSSESLESSQTQMSQSPPVTVQETPVTVQEKPGQQREFRLRLCYEIKDDDLRFMRPNQYDLESAMTLLNRRQKEEKQYQSFQQKFVLAKANNKTFSFILHPQSNLRTAWDVGSVIMLGYDCIMTPLQLIMDTEPTGIVVCGWIVNGFWSLDIGVSFITGFYKDAQLIMDWRAIAQSYVSTFFLFDLLVILPDWIAAAFETNSDITKSLSSLRALKMVRFLRLMRMIKLKRLINEFLGSFNADGSMAPVIRLVSLMAAILEVMHIMACFWYVLGDSDDGWAATLRGADLPQRYWVSLLWSMSHLQGTSPMAQLQTEERVFAVATIMVGLVLVALFIGTMTRILGQRTDFLHDLTAQSLAVRAFAQRHDVSVGLCIQMRQHLETQMLSRDALDRETKLLELLPSGLLMDLLYESRGTTCSRHVLFQFLDTRNTQFIRQMCTEAISHKTCRAGEVIFSEGNACKHVRFVREGGLKYLHTTMGVRISGDADSLPQEQPAAAARVEHSMRVSASLSGGTAFLRGSTENLNVEERAETLDAGRYISEACLWTLWQNCGFCVSSEAGLLLLLNADDFQQVIVQHPEVHWISVLYARQFILKLNRTPQNDLFESPSVQEWEPEAIDVVSKEEQDLPWEEELPSHISSCVAKASVKLAQLIASEGLDENRPHHGFTVIVGHESLLAECGKSGFNPFQGHDLRLVNAQGQMDKDVFDTLRRNAFHGDGAICLDGQTGKVIASGWFVGDIRLGGSAGGARSRSAKAIAQQAGKCYVIKASEDSRGKVILHLGTNLMPFSGKLKD